MTIPMVDARYARSMVISGPGSAPVEPAQLLTLGPLAARAHRLLGLGAVGSARLGQTLPSLVQAFGGDTLTWSHAGTPWIAARSLARERETLPSHAATAWLLAGGSLRPER